VKNFVTCHSHPQSLDSGSTPEAFVKREIELGTGAVTCTDHGTLQACRKIYDLGKAAGITPVLGLEGYLRDDDCEILARNGYAKNANGAFTNAPKYMHFCVHFLDQAAYECCVKLLSKADERLEATLEKLEAKDRKHGQERKPLFVWRDLEELGAQNTTFTTGCMIGVVQRHLFDNNDAKTAGEYFDKLKAIVKPGNLYTELNPHDTSKDWIQGIFLTMADGTKLRFYADKKLMTNVGEITASNLAKTWGKSEHRTLKGIKDRSTWREVPEQEIRLAEDLEGFFQNECKPWAPNGDYQAGLNRAMRYMAKQRGIPIIVGDDSHYANRDEKVVQDVRLAQGGPWRFYSSYHRQSSDEAFEHFNRTLKTTEAEFEGWVENSHGWAGRFKDFKFETPPSLPTKFYEAEYEKRPWFKVGDADNSLRYTLELIRKHGRMDWNNTAMRERLQAEIKLLHHNGTIDLLPYFMVDEEVCSLYESHGLLTGPGRGSAAGLILTYLLGITHVDPLQYGLSLERFITQDRIASGGLPDIDQDLPHRELLVDPETGWLKKRFGDHYAQISVDSTLKLKMAVRDVSRAARKMVPGDIEGLAKKFVMPPQGVSDHDFVMGYHTDGEGDIPGSKDYDPALKEYIKRYPDDWKIVQKCLGLARQKGRHACAYVIANRPIHEFIPLTTISGVRCTAYTAPSVEAVGGLKMDFLVVNSLNDIGDCIKLVQQRHQAGLSFDETKLKGRRVPRHRLVPVLGNDGGYGDADYLLADIYDLPEDQDVFAEIATGKTETVFQFNTPGAVQWLQHFSHKKPNGNYAIDSIEGMAAFTALDRPGPLDMFVQNPDDETSHNLLVEFARRAAGKAPSGGILQAFNDLIPETYGVMVYQEQLQKMYQQLTGCTGPEAEDFRKNVAKKKKAKIDKAYPFFIEKATAKIGEANAKAAWEFFITWAKYGFNKSHAVCYVVLSYACAYLKHHYPLEWWTSVLRNASKNEVSDKFWRHCGKIIDLPDVKLSGENFEIQGERIRAPLSLLQGVGEAAAEQLKKYAPYTDVADFCAKIDEHQRVTGTMVEKTKKKKQKVVGPDGKKTSVEVEVKEQVLKKGYNALNRGVCHAMILSGAMDALFPPNTHVGDQLNLFEDALAAATKTKREKVDRELWDVGPLGRYQIRKRILPAYGEDLLPFLVDSFDRNFQDEPVMEWTPPNSSTGRVLNLNVASADDIDFYENAPMMSDQSVTLAVPAYVEDSEIRVFGDEHKEMCKIRLDVGGARYEFVQWPKKDSKQVADVYRQPLKGSIVVAVLNKWREDKPFQLQDLKIVQLPASAKKTKEETTDEQQNAG